jgi:hypothetical protein
MSIEKKTQQNLSQPSLAMCKIQYNMVIMVSVHPRITDKHFKVSGCNSVC